MALGRVDGGGWVGSVTLFWWNCFDRFGESGGGGTAAEELMREGLGIRVSCELMSWENLR